MHAPPHEPTLVGQRVLDVFRVEDELGRGGSGVVYRGTDLTSGMPVAIKTMLPDMKVPEMRARFLREAEVQLALNHPHLAAGIKAGTLPDGEPVLVTEFVEGETVYDAIYRGQKMTPRRALIIARQVLMGLEYAHGRNVLHRDLKPENVLLIEQGHPGARFFHVKVIDFGLVTHVTDTGNHRFPTLTVSGFTVGTPGYMAPEQALGAELDQRTDLYAVGTMIFEMMSRRLPFPEEDDGIRLQQMLSGAPPALTDIKPGPWCTLPVEALLARSLAASASHRFRDAHDMLQSVEGAFASLNHLPEDPPW